jgi:endonuclease YncB( thermonuclease family)
MAVRRMCLAVAVMATMAIVTSAQAETISGSASVIDGDTIQVNGEVIRILDIDAPEKGQFCSQAEGDVTGRCGEQAVFALIDLIGAQIVSCETDRLDRYKRHLARCMAGETDLGEWMAAEGWALPYGDCKCETIRAASEYAELNHLGLWVEPFILPWEWGTAN